MSVYPLMVEGASLRALVVGGGPVGVRKARGLLDAGATVRLIAPDIDPAVAELDPARLTVEQRTFHADDIGDATLVIAATSSRQVNSDVAREARNRGRLVNVVDAPAEGNCTTPAVHRAGDLVIAVTAGGVPAVAARVRDAIAARYSARFADAVVALSELRSELIGTGRRERWSALSASVVDADFCETVERGTLGERLAQWR